MTLSTWFQPTRRTFNPILTDESVIDPPGSPHSVFYSPAAQRLSRYVDLLIALGAGLSLSAAWAISLSDGPPPLRNVFVLLAFAVAGLPALSQVWEKIKTFRIDIDLLMLLGAGLAAYIGNPMEGALLLFLFALSGTMESFALRRTQSAISALRKLTPTEAMLVEGDRTRRVPLRLVEPGSVVLVRPGERVPVDGEVVAGGSTLDESAITGESIPRECTVGSKVFAGTQNHNGRLEVRVTKRATDTTLAKIVALVTEARHHPAKAQRTIDRIGPTYSVIVIVSAILVGLVGWSIFGLPGREAVRRAIGLLIVASPCALIIATPVAYLSAIAASARRGVLVKGGAHLESMARAAVVAFDKTGTLTTGRVRLTDIEGNGELTADEVLRLAGSLEASSSHPLAAAVKDALHAKGLTAPPVSEYRAIPGRGEAGVVEGRPVWIGRPELGTERLPTRVTQQLLSRTEELRKQGKTVSSLVVDRAAGLLAFEDSLRDRSSSCIEVLRRQGIQRIDMLTGDHHIVADRVAELLGLDGFQAELSPEDKLTAIRKLQTQYGTVVVVGDGINDAPALVHADVGVAMGSMGVDVALEAADIVLMKDRIDRIAWVHRHAQRTARIVAQNLTLAIAVIAVLSVLSVTVGIPLPLAVMGHEGSTVLVALNALRLLGSRDD